MVGLEVAKSVSQAAQNESRMDVKWGLRGWGADTSKSPASVPGVLRRGCGGHDREEQPAPRAGARSYEVTPWPSGSVVGAGGRQVIRCTTRGCEPVRTGQTPAWGQAGRGRCLKTSRAT